MHHVCDCTLREIVTQKEQYRCPPTGTICKVPLSLRSTPGDSIRVRTWKWVMPLVVEKKDKNGSHALWYYLKLKAGHSNRVGKQVRRITFVLAEWCFLFFFITVNVWRHCANSLVTSGVPTMRDFLTSVPKLCNPHTVALAHLECCRHLVLPLQYYH